MLRKTISGLAALAGCMLAACTTPATPAPAPIIAEAPPTADQIGQGRFLAETNCSRCHATGETGDSPRPDAPPLRRVLAQYEADAIEIGFLRGLRVGHPDMPRFEFDQSAIDALIAYLESIQDWDLAAAPPSSTSPAQRGAS